MADYAVMPKADYLDACNAIREKTGGTDVIKSGEMGAKIRAIESSPKPTNIIVKGADPNAYKVWDQKGLLYEIGEYVDYTTDGVMVSVTTFLLFAYKDRTQSLLHRHNGYIQTKTGERLNFTAVNSGLCDDTMLNFTVLDFTAFGLSASDIDFVYFGAIVD